LRPRPLAGLCCGGNVLFPTVWFGEDGQAGDGESTGLLLGLLRLLLDFGDFGDLDVDTEEGRFRVDVRRVLLELIVKFGKLAATIGAAVFAGTMGDVIKSSTSSNRKESGARSDCG